MVFTNKNCLFFFKNEKYVFLVNLKPIGSTSEPIKSNELPTESAVCDILDNNPVSNMILIMEFFSF